MNRGNKKKKGKTKCSKEIFFVNIKTYCWQQHFINIEHSLSFYMKIYKFFFFSKFILHFGKSLFLCFVLTKNIKKKNVEKNAPCCLNCSHNISLDIVCKVQHVFLQYIVGAEKKNNLTFVGMFVGFMYKRKISLKFTI